MSALAFAAGIEAQQETASAHVNNARAVLLPLIEDTDAPLPEHVVRALQAINYRLEKAVEQLKGEQDALTVARATLAGVEAERDELRDELREAREQLGAREYVGIFPSVDYEGRQFIIERRWREPIARYSDWELATAALKKVRAEDAAARMTTTTTTHRAAGAGE